MAYIGSRRWLLGSGDVRSYLASRGLSGSVAGADFQNQKFWLPTLPAGSIAGASTAELIPRWANEAEWTAQYVASSTSARTYFDQSGVLQSNLAANALRYSWENGRLWLVLENASTNLLLGSGTLTTSWALSRVSVSTNATTSPDGTVNASKLVEDTNTGTHRIIQTITKAASPLTYTASVFLKAAGRTFAQIRVSEYGETNVSGVAIDLSTGALGSPYGAFSSMSATSEAIGNGWYRLKFAFTTLSDTNLVMFVLPARSIAASSPSYTGDGVSGIYAWAAQLEQQGFASHYIATSGSAVTRNIETFRLPAVVEALLQRSEAVVLTRGRSAVAGLGSTYRRILGIDTTGYYGASKSDTVARMANAGDANGFDVTAGSGTFTTGFALAAAQSASGRAISLNGAAAQTDASAIGTRTTTYLARDASNGVGTFGDGLYNAIVVFPTRKDDAALPTLTATGW